MAQSSNHSATRHASKRTIEGESEIQGVIEEYRLNGQHFTRSIRIATTGGSCSQTFAVDGQDIKDEHQWLELLIRARGTFEG